MKKLLLFFALFTLLSCKEEKSAATPMLEIPGQVVSFEAKGNSLKIPITTNIANWSTHVEAAGKDWCTTSIPETGTLLITATQNQQMETRSTKVTVKAGDLSKTITVTQLGEGEDILVPFAEKTLGVEKTVLEIIVTSNVDYEIINKSDWIQENAGLTKMVDKTHSFFIDANFGAERIGTIEFKQKNGSISKFITITQTAGNIGGLFEQDIKVPVSSGKASAQQSVEPIENSFDSDMNTMYHSPYNGQTIFPVTLTYFFTNADRIDYATIHARVSGANGHFKEFDVYAKSTNGSEKPLGSYDFMGTGGSKSVPLNVERPEYIKFVVRSGMGDAVGDYVSCAEMEFYKSAQGKSEIFTDQSYSALKPEVTLAQIDALTNPLLKDIAQRLYNGTYDATFKVQQYKAYPSTNALARDLKLGAGFSRYENITGMYLKKGTAVVMVGNTGGKIISLLLPDLMRQPTPGYAPDKDPKGWGLYAQTVALREGINVFEVTQDANAYISYYDDYPENAPAITVHFPVGEINGYFDASKHTDADWNNLLDNAVSPIMDAKGKYIQVAYPVSFFQQYTYGKGLELINNYDKMLLNHYTVMGLVKYNKLPKNRIFARVNFNYYMFRDGDGVAYLGNSSTMNMVANPAVVIKGDPCWGFCHEAGHVLQMIPQMTWGGMTEVSNNVYTMYTTLAMGNTSRLKNDNHYAKARTSIINAKISYLQNPDVLERLVPFWQLHLYFKSVGKPNFYADLMETLRNRPAAGTGSESINNMFEFIKLSCDVGKTDLTDFFDKWGFFYVGTITVTDYSDYNFVVTQAKVNEVKNYIASKGYPKPNVDITTLED